MASKKIGKALIDFNVYLGDKGERLVGAGNVELPEIEMLKAELNVAGTAGKMNIALRGQTDAMEATITAPMPTRQMIVAAIADSQLITVRGAIEVYNPTAGKSECPNLTVVMRGTFGGRKLGNFEKGSAMESSIKFDLDYYKEILDGEELIEIDKFNNKFVVDGKDYLSAVRAAI